MLTSEIYTADTLSADVVFLLSVTIGAGSFVVYNLFSVITLLTRLIRLLVTTPQSHIVSLFRCHYSPYGIVENAGLILLMRPQ